MSRNANQAVSLVVCLEAGEYEGVDLFRGRLYQSMPDAKAEAHKQIQLVDESGEDYLYPAEWFVPVELTEPIRKVLTSG